MYLVDTNIFLEILLDQERKKDCEEFLNENSDNISISDFSLHSIGVILFKNSKEQIFSKFINDIITNINILTLPKDCYQELKKIKDTNNLDFDDAYQYLTARKLNLEIVTFDKDFNKIKDIEINFL